MMMKILRERERDFFWAMGVFIDDRTGLAIIARFPPHPHKKNARAQGHS